MNEDKPEEVVQTFDLDKIQVSKNIVSMHQEGNFLVCKTDKNQTFRQGIPAGKMLNKNEKGDWILEDIVVR